MASFMKKFEAQTYAALRIVVGFLFLCHGSQKLFSFPADAPTQMPAPMLYFVGSIEFFGGLLVMIGLFAGWAGFLCSGLMAAAYWMAHGLNAPLPIQNGGESAVLYCFAFLVIAAKGSGMWSVDAARSGEG